MCLALPLGAIAQASPAEPATAAAPLHYQSTFSDYKPWRDLQPGNWRGMNDALGAAPSGHGGHGAGPGPAGASPAQAPASSAPHQPAPAASDDGHQMHGGHK